MENLQSTYGYKGPEHVCGHTFDLVLMALNETKRIHVRTYAYTNHTSNLHVRTYAYTNHTSNLYVRTYAYTNHTSNFLDEA